jgi:hypothetical protein
MCGYLSQAFERTKHMPGNMVTDKPSDFGKPNPSAKQLYGLEVEE